MLVVVTNHMTYIWMSNIIDIWLKQGGSGFAKNIKFMNIQMRNVSNPIIIDQNYCDQQEPCQEQESAIKEMSIYVKNKGRSYMTKCNKYSFVKG